jgi:hypothetical protein
VTQSHRLIVARVRSAYRSSGEIANALSSSAFAVAFAALPSASRCVCQSSVARKVRSRTSSASRGLFLARLTSAWMASVDPLSHAGTCCF